MTAALQEANRFHSIIPKTNSIVLELSGRLKSIKEIRPMKQWD
ncbi:23960_t:CDS:1, partial [Gigaspora margarita]